MEPVPESLKFTYQDYLLTPEDKRYELIDGDLYMTPSPTPFHQIVSHRIAFALTLFVQEQGLGQVLYAPCDVYFSRYDVLQPDIMFIASDRLRIIQEKYIRGAPDLVVEILSPSTSDRDRELKLRLYARYGVLEYWIVDPEANSIEVLKRPGKELEIVQTYTGQDGLESPLLEGFRLPLTPVFKKLPLG